jgi:long-chain acyl-CoA synthetase
MFKTAGGKYVAPQVLENKYMESKFIAQVMVVGENRRFPAALIVPAFDELKAWAAYKGIPVDDNRELVNDPAVKDKYQREIDRLNTAFGHWEQAKKVAVLPSEWTIDAGELTPKLSLRRKVILDRYKDEIEGLYKENK